MSIRSSFSFVTTNPCPEMDVQRLPLDTTTCRSVITSSFLTLSTTVVSPVTKTLGIFTAKFFSYCHGRLLQHAWIFFMQSYATVYSVSRKISLKLPFPPYGSHRLRPIRSLLHIQGLPQPGKDRLCCSVLIHPAGS